MTSAAKRRSGKIIFVTGTDTGVGKTLLTALLLHHLRRTGRRALAMKPFCSGSRADVELLQFLQAGELPMEDANPFYFPEPVAPLVAAKKRRLRITLDEVLNRIHRVQSQCEQLLIEGSGGLLVPLGEGYTVADLIARLDCRVVVASRNRLGTINHTLLTVKALQAIGARRIRVVLMGGKPMDISSKTNQRVLRELLNAPVFSLPFLGQSAGSARTLKNSYKKVKKTLAHILE